MKSRPIDDLFCSTRVYVVLAVSDRRKVSRWAVEKCEMSGKTRRRRAIHSVTNSIVIRSSPC